MREVKWIKTPDVTRLARLCLHLLISSLQISLLLAALWKGRGALAVNLYCELFCVPKHEKALQTPTLWARGASRPGRQRTGAEVEEEGWKDGWRKKLHRGGHLITASDVNINRSEDEAACRCERRWQPPPHPFQKKTAVQKGGKEEAWEDRGFQRHCDPLWFNQQQNC